MYAILADREQAEICLDSFLEDDNARNRPYRITSTNREKLLRMMVEADDCSAIDFLKCCKDSLSN